MPDTGEARGDDDAQAAAADEMTSTAPGSEDPSPAAAASAAPAEESAAASAAVALVTSHGRSVSGVKASNRARLIGMTVITVGVFAYMACIATGMALSQWADEAFVSDDLPEAIQFVGKNADLVVLVHVAVGLVAALFILGYGIAHARFVRRYNDLDKELRPRPVVPTWYVVGMVAIVFTGLVGTAVVSQAIPDRPGHEQMYEDEKARNSGVIDEIDPLGLMQRDRSPITEEVDTSLLGILQNTPRYVVGKEAKEAWLLHTLWLPLGTGLMLLLLLPAVYSIQRSKPDEPKALRRRGNEKKTKADEKTPG